MIRKYLFIIFALLSVTVYGQTAQSVLDTTSKKLTGGGTYANFTAVVEGNNVWGNIAIKGQRFKITTGNAITWYDGKTQWTYIQSTNEVNISNPSAAQQQQINPYHFINLYKKGYSSHLTKKGALYVITLKKTSGKGGITDAVIEINSKTYYPSHIKIKNEGKWNTFNISSIKKVNYNTSHFRFPKKGFEGAEVIDLR